mmetsp:Transcript_4084/g.6636  ORF Transcript_4084/g.6636 Transcript_4084/m.6636 type:complete len:133 (+) Transcript_4084:1-399(+)
MRPWGASALIGGIGVDGPALWLVEPNGVSHGYFATAVGKGARAAKSELEKLDLKEMTVNQLVDELTRIIYFAHDEAKDQDKPFVVELGWAGPASNNNFDIVPDDVRQAAIKKAEEALNARDDSDDDDDDMDK